jgi:hypothetical protein
MLIQVGTFVPSATWALIVENIPPSLPTRRMLDEPFTNARAC